MQRDGAEVGEEEEEDFSVELSSSRKRMCPVLAGAGCGMRGGGKKAFFFLSLGGNGAFLSIKDAVTCLRHHVGYELGCARNFGQLIFPSPGAFTVLCDPCFRLFGHAFGLGWG